MNIPINFPHSSLSDSNISNTESDSNISSSNTAANFSNSNIAIPNETIFYLPSTNSSNTTQVAYRFKQKYENMNSPIRKNMKSVAEKAFRGFDSSTIVSPSRKPENELKEATRKEKIEQKIEVSVPYFYQKLNYGSFRTDIIYYLSKTRAGQEILAEIVETIAIESEENKKNINSKLKPLLKISKSKKIDEFPFLRHIFGLDEALMSPRQWSSYYKLQVKDFGLMGSEQGRRGGTYLHRFISNILKIELIGSNTRIAYRNPELILNLMVRTLKNAYPNLNFEDYRLLVRVSVDSRNLKPFNSFICWTIIGLQQLKGVLSPLTVDVSVRDVFPTQHWKSVLALVLWEGSETYSTVTQNCSEVICERVLIQ